MSDEAVGRIPNPADGETAMGLDGLTEEILPALIARLRASRLAELEVRSDGWRVRLRRDLRATRRSARGHSADGLGADAADDQAPGVATSPAVGYFTPAPRLVVGRSVAVGDPIGSVDVLGIPQEVTAPMAGIVSMVMAESGQAVEYGQPLAEIDSFGADLGADLDAGDDDAGVAGR